MSKRPREIIEQEVQAYSHEQTAKLLGVQNHTLAQWRSQGRGPAYYKMGRMVVYKLRDILDWQERSMERHCPVR